MNILKKSARKTIKWTFDFAVATISRFSKMNQFHEKVDALRKMEDGTLGKEIADCLDSHGLTLVPKFESHDLKHVLLNYKMTPEDEIRMQAFMIGNGNYSFPSFAIFAFGALLLPDLWSTFYGDFKKGRNTLPISDWTIDEFASKKLCDLRMKIAPRETKKSYITNMGKLTRFATLSSVGTGIFGMLYCLPYLFSSNTADLIGAGFPFVGGAILVIGGLIALSIQTRFKTDYSDTAQSINSGKR